MLLLILINYSNAMKIIFFKNVSENRLSLNSLFDTISVSVEFCANVLVKNTDFLFKVFIVCTMYIVVCSISQ